MNVIIGGGPTGLTIAWYLAQLGQKSIIIEKEKELGGCHKVVRVDGLMTEHGPRVYSNSFINFHQLLNEMNLNPDHLFVNYKFGFKDIIGSLNLQISEILTLLNYIILFLIYPPFLQSKTVGEMIKNFTPKTKSFFRKVCKLTESADVDRYTVQELISLIMTGPWYQFQQPKYPNDVALFKLWKQKLEQTGLVTIMTQHELVSINVVDQKTIGSITVINHNDQQKQIMIGERYILAIPPRSLIPIIYSSPRLFCSKKDEEKMLEWIKDVKYDDYLSIIFYWDGIGMRSHRDGMGMGCHRDNVGTSMTSKWGIPNGPWFIIHIVLSDYIQFERSGLVISSCIANLDVPNQDGLTANQCNQQQLIDYTFEQLNQMYDNELSKPDRSLIYPGVRSKINHPSKWITSDSAFVLTPKGYHDQSLLSHIDNLYWSGIHNGNADLPVTTIETAIIEAKHTVGQMTNKRHRICSIFGINHLIVIIVWLFLFYWMRNI